MVTRESTEAVVPESVVDAVNRTICNIAELSSNFIEFMSNFDDDVLAEMPPLRRAQALLALSKAASVLFTLWLRCSGVHPDNHPLRSELERLSLYEDKLEKCNAWSEEPLRRSTTINHQAATRFIEHSLPDLSAEQKQSLRDISRSEGRKSSLHENRGAHKRRKCRSSEKQQSVRDAAREFLEKATRELLVAEGDVKGPLRIQSSDEDDPPVS